MGFVRWEASATSSQPPGSLVSRQHETPAYVGNAHLQSCTLID